MNKPIYNVFQCNRCLEMEYSYFDHSVHRWCKAYGCILSGMCNLKKNIDCKEFNKAPKGKAKYLRKEEYLRKYPE